MEFTKGEEKREGEGLPNCCRWRRSGWSQLQRRSVVPTVVPGRGGDDDDGGGGREDGDVVLTAVPERNGDGQVDGMVPRGGGEGRVDGAVEGARWRWTWRK
jgi:hypothetical protein